MTVAQEHRNFWRAPFHKEAQLIDATGTWQADLLDLSLKGALLEMPANWTGACGKTCHLKLNLGEGATIHMKGHIAHVAGQRMGLRCSDIDIDSISHLRRLVELNSGDPALLERELTAFLQQN